MFLLPRSSEDAHNKDYCALNPLKNLCVCGCVRVNVYIRSGPGARVGRSVRVCRSENNLSLSSSSGARNLETVFLTDLELIEKAMLAE